MEMQRYVGENLYHLVGGRHPEADEANCETLGASLRSMELRTCEVAGHRGGIRMMRDPSRPVTNGEPIQQSVICLCDIPRQDLKFHARRYGRFGLGVNRSVVAQWGCRPVTYVPFSRKVPGNWGARFPSEISSVLDGLDRFFPDSPAVRSKVAGVPTKDEQEAVDEASSLITRDVQAFLKLWDVDLPEDHPENFYMEREWRKFGNLGLASCLQEIVAPPRYHDHFRSILDGLRVDGRYLVGDVEFTSIPY